MHRVSTVPSTRTHGHTEHVSSAIIEGAGNTSGRLMLTLEINVRLTRDSPPSPLAMAYI